MSKREIKELQVSLKKARDIANIQKRRAETWKGIAQELDRELNNSESQNLEREELCQMENTRTNISFEISRKTLSMIDNSLENMKKGLVSSPIDLQEFKEE